MIRCRFCEVEFSDGALTNGVCPQCRRDGAGTQSFDRSFKSPSALPKQASKILLTTETHLSEPIAKRIDVISAEAVLGMNIFKDIGSAWRDVVGGRNKSVQDELRAARKAVLGELKREAAELGADAVIAVDLDYSEISGGGKSMMLLVASGTAVKLA